MSRDNVEAIRTLFGAFEGVDVASIDWTSEGIRQVLAGAASEDVELTTLQSGIGSGVGAHYEGIDGFIRYLGEWLEPFSEYRVENVDYIDAGDCVLVPSRQWGKGDGSGIRVEIELTTLYELRDGLVVRMHQFDTLDEARAAASPDAE